VKRRAVLIATGSLIAALACPIQRPPVPAEYLDFRADLQAAVTDTAVVVLEGQLAMTGTATANVRRLTPSSSVWVQRFVA